MIAERRKHQVRRDGEPAGPYPAVVIMDGATIHAVPAVLAIALKYDIQICALPAHTSTVTQPLDVSVLAMYKNRWDAARRMHEREVGPVTLWTVAEVIASFHKDVLTKPGLIKAGFRKTGTWPINRDAIPDSVLCHPEAEIAAAEVLEASPATVLGPQAANIQKSPAPTAAASSSANHNSALAAPAAKGVVVEPVGGAGGPATAAAAAPLHGDDSPTACTFPSCTSRTQTACCECSKPCCGIHSAGDGMADRTCWQCLAASGP